MSDRGYYSFLNVWKLLLECFIKFFGAGISKCLSKDSNKEGHANT